MRAGDLLLGDPKRHGVEGSMPPRALGSLAKVGLAACMGRQHGLQRELPHSVCMEFCACTNAAAMAPKSFKVGGDECCCGKGSA